ncbi:hypothetical protein [Aestuariivivens sediminicola]|uniref:hypothetical protein n=1 Tax=Aestuariivivens sediminicola TaxID=2913560 RepID=UPI001F583780|nr:hypothetical protein [Aestuariivivens sediminicola]
MTTRVFLSLLGAIISLVSLGLLFSFSLRGYVDQSYKHYISLFIALCIGVFLFIYSKNFSKSLSMYSFIGGILIGGIAGALGLIGPIIFSDSNLGPLLGIFFTGPLGFLIGLIGGGIYWKIKVQNTN